MIAKDVIIVILPTITRFGFPPQVWDFRQDPVHQHVSFLVALCILHTGDNAVRLLIVPEVRTQRLKLARSSSG
jgi:hypothetical protein